MQRTKDTSGISPGGSFTPGFRNKSPKNYHFLPIQDVYSSFLAGIYGKKI